MVKTHTLTIDKLAHPLYGGPLIRYNIKVHNEQAMSELRTKFRKSIGIFQDAVNRTIELDYSQPKLYKKVRKYYQEQGVVFTGDSVEDYQILLENIEYDLKLETA